MPDNAPKSYEKPILVAQSGARETPLRVQRDPPVSPNPNRPPPGWTILLGSLVLIALITAIAYWVRRSAYRTWEAYARDIGGEFRPKNGLSPGLITGAIRDRPIIMEVATSHEDEAGYYHTRMRVPVKNAGAFIMGLRRKSYLELAQTRRDAAPFSLDDPQFERQFFLYCNDNENLPAILNKDARQELMRYSDVEIYIRMGEMEWRRAGEQSDVKAIQRLTDLLLCMAETVDRFPSRGRSLTQCLADEKLIDKGV